MKFITTFLIIAFIVLAAFGLFVPVMHAEHGMSCVFGGGVCGMVLLHVEHWLSSFVAVLVSLLLLVPAAFVASLSFRPRRQYEPQYERYRVRVRAPLHPVLFQELCSRGIMHPKVPRLS